MCRRPRSLSLLLACLLLAGACRPSLAPNHPREARLVDAAGHRYALDVPAGHYVRGIVEPSPELDVAVRFRGIGGDAVEAGVDQEGPGAAERFHFVADADTRLEVAVRGFLGSSTEPIDESARRYVLRLDAARPASDDDRRRAESHALLLSELEAAGDCRVERPRLERADVLFRSLDEPTPDDAFTHAVVLLALGECLTRDLGDPHAAIEILERARDLAIRSRDRAGVEPHILAALGTAERRADRPEPARAHLLAAIEGFERQGNDSARLAASLTLATVLTDLGDYEENRRLLQEILSEAREAGLRKHVVYGIANQAWSLVRRGRAAEAEELLVDAERFLPPDRNASLHGVLRALRGFAALDTGDFEAADRHFETSLERLEDPNFEVVSWAGRAYVAVARKDPAPASHFAEEALAIARQLAVPSLEARAYDARARARALLGTPEALRAALEDAERALERIESTRPDRFHERAGFLDRHWNLVEAPVSIAVALHEIEPGADWAERAFANAERIRFRTLVEALGEARSPKPAQSPRLLGIDEIRRLLDDETALVQFHLGEEKSFLFRVSSSGLDVFSLGPRDEIESRAERVRELATRLGHRPLPSRAELLEARRAYPVEARELVRRLLGPALEGLDAPRLLVAADGALHTLPFGALPEPDSPTGEDWRPLLVEREIVHVPSTSVIAQLRAAEQRSERRAGSRESAEDSARDLVIYADPVFGAPDPRLPPEVSAPRAELSRLDYTAAEAEALAGLAGVRPRIYTGFDATREQVLDGGLEGYRILHFATHALADRRPPSLALSFVDRRGLPLDGFVTVADLSGLDLDAELAVLSACDTAIGPERKGEGLLGLARGFLNAGVPRVVASAWAVDDRATRELMVDFYARLLGDGERPAAALRAAQLAMRERGEPLYHWAPFALQGEWQ